MEPSLEYYYSSQAVGAISSFNDGDITPGQFIRKFSHSAGDLSYYGKQQILQKIINNINGQIYYAVRKLKFHNLRALIDFLSEGFLYSNSFGHFATELGNTRRGHEVHYSDFSLKLQDILREAEYHLKNSRFEFSDIFLRQLDVYARVVFVQELPSILHRDVYESAPETLYEACKLANYFYYTYCTSFNPVRSEFIRLPPIEIQEENYYPAPRLENSYALSNQYDYYENRSSRKESVSKSINSEYDYSLPESCFQKSSNNCLESSEIDSDSTLTNSNSESEEFSKFSVSSESSEDLHNSERVTAIRDSAESGKGLISEDSSETKRPVLRYYLLRIASPANSSPKVANQNNSTKFNTSKSEILKINSKLDKSPVSDFCDVSEYQLTPTICETLSPECPNFSATMPDRSSNDQGRPIAIQIDEHIFPIEYTQEASNIHLETSDISQDTTTTENKLEIILPQVENSKIGNENNLAKTETKINKAFEMNSVIDESNEDSARDLCDFPEFKFPSIAYAKLSVCPHISNKNKVTFDPSVVRHCQKPCTTPYTTVLK